MNNSTRCGFIAIIGRPNVGKSTLLNALIGEKVSITSRKPQTTRHQILGIQTHDHIQAIYVDTPGIQQKQKTAVHRYMNRTAYASLHDVDVIVFVIEADKWMADDETILKAIAKIKAPVILALNKVDKIADKNSLFTKLEMFNEKFSWTEIIPFSAKTKVNLEALSKCVERLLPEREHSFSEDSLTDRSERFLASEMIREKLIRNLGQELPYVITVQIEQFKEEKALIRMGAIIWVEKDGQKAIVIGRKGEGLKTIGREARLDMERLFKKKIFLQLWVKVKDSSI